MPQITITEGSVCSRDSSVRLLQDHERPTSRGSHFSLSKP